MTSYPVPDDAKPITIVPRNVAILGGNVTAAYVFTYLLGVCKDEEHGIVPMPVSMTDMATNLGLSLDRVRTALKYLENAQILDVIETTAANHPRLYFPNVEIVEVPK